MAHSSAQQADGGAARDTPPSIEAHRVAFVRGGPEDETGPEMADAAMQVLDHLLALDGAPAIDFVPIQSGVHCYREHGSSLPEESLATILKLGIAFKAPNASAATANERPTSLILRHSLGTYASVNYIRSYPGVVRSITKAVDLVLVRDNIEGLFAAPSAYKTNDISADLRVITRAGAERLARIAFDIARDRRGLVTVCAFPVGINSDRLFIESCEAVAQDYPSVTMNVRKVDSLVGTIVASPDQYDVVVAPSEWGSIVTDGFAAAAGSVGLAARANLGDATAYFEPIHGTAPGKTGKGTVNPVSQILAAALLLGWLGSNRGDARAGRAGRSLRDAIATALSTGDVLTVDIGGTSTTQQLVDAIRAALPSAIEGGACDG